MRMKTGEENLLGPLLISIDIKFATMRVPRY